jgi:5-methylcytosine-specific restriction protein A
VPAVSSKRPIYQTSEWRKATRKRVLERDGYRCRVCHAAGKEIGGRVTLTVAHVIPERVRPDLGYVLENLRALCRACHGREDGGRRYS